MSTIAEDDVVAGISINRVAGRTTDHNIAVLIAMNRIGAASAGICRQHVCRDTARVIHAAAVAENNFFAYVATDEVSPLTAKDQIVAMTAADRTTTAIFWRGCTYL